MAMAPEPPLTLKRLALPFSVQGPPVAALPQPLVTVRAKASLATTTGASVAVTSWTTDPVSPSSSVTVSVTSYVPAAA